MNQILESLKDLDLDEAQARLETLPGSINNIFGKNTWKFEDQRGRPITVDFDDLRGIGEIFPNWPLAKSLDWVQVTKRIWLSHDLRSIGAYSTRLAGLKLLWAAMANYQLIYINRDNCSLILRHLLTHTWQQGKASKNLSIRSHGSFSAHIKLTSLKLALMNIGLNFIARDVTETVIKKHLQILIPELTDGAMTSRDWFEGGSYNLLTLDHGRYYVEHCLDIFEKHYPLAFALASTFRAIPDLADSLGYKQRTVSLFSNLLLRGISPKELHQRWPQWAITTLKNVRDVLIRYFLESYQKASFETTLLQDATLKNFVLACGLRSSPENIDRMRVILWDWVRRNNKEETKCLLKECQKPIPWTVFQKNIASVKSQCDQQLFRVPTVSDYQAIGLTEGDLRDPTLTYPRQLIFLVAKAGLTSVVALTGWRGSEFGFPLSAIKRTPNHDRLDQYAFPWRYQIDWYVYKTSGKVRQNREITFSIVLLAERLRSLHNATNEQPCLYPISESNKRVFDSINSVGNAVRAIWGNFVNHYSGFRQLDDYTRWLALCEANDSGKPLTKLQKKDYIRISAQYTENDWTNLHADQNLHHVWHRVREEWPRLEFFLTGGGKKDKSDWLIRYRDGSLKPDWRDLLDKHLSDEKKDIIQGLSSEELRSATVTRAIANNLAEGTLYPSPHAFRHMWAEAVYRRFDGDAGWMIRSQFKHVSRAMWLAYIRDKNNRPSHETAKKQVISSLVNNYFKRKGEGYSGQLHTWLRRLTRSTTVATPQEQEQLAEHLATVEIENIKANPWGYCLLKRRTRSKAKCSEMGEPMRHNASPDLCLGCVHNLMQAENVEWTLFHAASHVNALKNPVVPAIFKASSYELVKNVTQHVRTLNPHHDAIPELQETLDNYKLSRDN